MKWTLEMVKAKHWVGWDRQTAYYDSPSNTCVPMHDDDFSSRAIMEMEEFSQADEGVIFLDIKTNKTGLLIRG